MRWKFWTSDEDKVIDPVVETLLDQLRELHEIIEKINNTVNSVKEDLSLQRGLINDKINKSHDLEIAVQEMRRGAEFNGKIIDRLLDKDSSLPKSTSVNGHSDDDKEAIEFYARYKKLPAATKGYISTKVSQNGSSS